MKMIVFAIALNLFASLAVAVQNFKPIFDCANALLAEDIKLHLNEKIKGKKYVFLGESHHYFEEKYDYRYRFIEFLVAQGFRQIYAEMGRADSQMIDLYLSIGNEALFDYVGLYGFKSDKLDAESRAHRQAEIRFFKKLRKLKQKYPDLHYGGWDLDIYPNTGFLVLDSWEKSLDPQRKFSQLWDAINEAEKLEGQERLVLLQKAQWILKENEIAIRKLFAVVELSLGNYEDLFLDIKVLIDSSEYSYLVKIYNEPGKDYDEDQLRMLARSLEFREMKLFENFLHLRRTKFFEEKAIFLGHNGHLTKTTDQFDAPIAGHPWNVAIGSFINSLEKNQIYGIWSLIGGSEERSQKGKEVFPVLKGSLEEKLLADYPRDKKYLIPIDDSFVGMDIKVMINNSMLSGGPIQDFTDAIYFIPSVSKEKLDSEKSE